LKSHEHPWRINDGTEILMQAFLNPFFLKLKIATKLVQYGALNSRLYKWKFDLNFWKFRCKGTKKVESYWRKLFLRKWFHFSLFQLQTCLKALLSEMEKNLINFLGRGFKSQPKQHRLKRNWSFSDLFDRIFKIFSVNFKFSACIQQRPYNKVLLLWFSFSKRPCWMQAENWKFVMKILKFWKCDRINLKNSCQYELI
jgi:hypothetical protein